MDTTTGSAEGAWQVESGSLVATFATGSMVNGLAFVERVVDAAEAAGHHPDIDFTYPRVRLSLVTHDADDTITDKDLALAETIDGVAAELGIAAQ